MRDSKKDDKINAGCQQHLLQPLHRDIGERESVGSRFFVLCHRSYPGYRVEGTESRLKQQQLGLSASQPTAFCMKKEDIS